MAFEHTRSQHGKCYVKGFSNSHAHPQGSYNPQHSQPPLQQVCTICGL